MSSPRLHSATPLSICDFAAIGFPSHVATMPGNMSALSLEYASALQLSVNALSRDPLHHTYTAAQNCQSISRLNLPLLSTALVPALALLDEQVHGGGIETRTLIP